MPPDDKSIAERIRELEHEIRALKGDADRPLTVAEIRRLTPEQARERWDEIRHRLIRDADGDGGDPGRDDDRDGDRDRDGSGGRGKPAPGGDRISRALAATDPRAAKPESRLRRGIEATNPTTTRRTDR